MMDGGPITHLFTDLEGSTRLWELEPARMHEALDRHDALASAVVDRFGGRIVKKTGDGLHAAFGDAVDGTLACVQFALDLEALARECALPLRARCGLHAGVAHARDGDYFGGAVNRTARIMGAAHGGQLLMSETVAAMVRDRLPAALTLRELGKVRLRDLARPSRSTSSSIPISTRISHRCARSIRRRTTCPNSRALSWAGTAPLPSCANFSASIGS